MTFVHLLDRQSCPNISILVYDTDAACRYSGRGPPRHTSTIIGFTNGFDATRDDVHDAMALVCWRPGGMWLLA